MRRWEDINFCRRIRRMRQTGTAFNTSFDFDTLLFKEDSGRQGLSLAILDKAGSPQYTLRLEMSAEIGVARFMIDDVFEPSKSRFRVTDHGMIVPPVDTVGSSGCKVARESEKVLSLSFSASVQVPQISL
jgi:hypothetical protein